MNQILSVKNKNKKLIIFLKLQIVIFFLSIIALIIYILNENKLKNEEELITNSISQNARIIELFEDNNLINNGEIYFCKLKIEKINLEYFVYQNYSDELLKILPCKFFGNSLENDENICIIGHNYFDDRFFGNLNQIEIGDKIILENLNGKVYNYYVYKIYEVQETEISKVVNEEYERTVTLCTCTFDKNKRLVVKAKGA